MTGGAVPVGRGARITARRAEVAESKPATFVPVTTTRSAWPTSAAERLCVAFVAPLMSEQFEPSASQRCHW